MMKKPTKAEMKKVLQPWGWHTSKMNYAEMYAAYLQELQVLIIPYEV